MDNTQRLRKILVPGDTLTPCTTCGELLGPIDGRVFNSCKEWGDFAMSQFSPPMSFSMVLPFLLMRKLCRLEFMISQQSSALADIQER